HGPPGMSKSARALRPADEHAGRGCHASGGSNAMKYMLMMNVPGKGPYQIGSWPKKDIQAHIGHMIALKKKLREAGEFVTAEGLSGPDQATRVRAGAGGAPITDGVFP